MATIGDVARTVGVSRSTVSYALSGKRPVSTEVKERIGRAIRELDFYPSAAARALATQRSQTIALLAPMGENATPAVALQFVNGVAQASRRLGYDTLLITGPEAFDGVDRLIRSDQVDGLVLLDVERDDPRLGHLDAKPTVLVGRAEHDEQLDSVDLDWFRAAELLVGHLVELGHRSIILLGAPAAAYEMGMTYAERFLDGARAASARTAGVMLHEITLTGEYERNARMVESVLGRGTKITGVIVQHEAMTTLLPGMLRSLGRRVPDDVSIVGVGLDAFGATFGSAVSGVDTPSAAITEQAVRMLVERLDAADLPIRNVLITPEFRERGTTSPIHR